MKNLFVTFLVALALSACGARYPSGGTSGGSSSTSLFGSSGSGGSIPADAEQDIIVQKVDKDDVRDIIREERMVAYDSSDNDLVFSAVGEGIAPLSTVSAAQAVALAKRAALVDAYRNLATKLYGIKINGKDTVKDAMLVSSTVTAQVNGLIKNASVIDEFFDQGLYRVNVELKIDADKWKELFAY